MPQRSLPSPFLPRFHPILCWLYTSLCYPQSMSDPPAYAAPKTIRVVAPAGPVAVDDLERGVEILGRRGFTARISPHAQERHGYLAGADESRLSDLQAALDDPDVDVVCFARGGYGTTRLLPLLSREGLARHPKILAGFSDATALLAWAQDVPGVRRLYAPSVQELAREGVCEMDSLWAALEGRDVQIPAEGNPDEAAGPFPVAGGCLTLLSVSVGTPWEPDVSGCWLFLEDVGEPLYRIDRMMTHLQQAGWFGRAAGLLLGGFTGMGEGESPSQAAQRARQLLGSHKPLLTGLPVGHLKGKRALPLGCPATWDGSALIVAGAGTPVPET